MGWIITIISSIILGAILGALGRLVVPGKQNFSMLITIILGIIAALVGGAIFNAVAGVDGSTILRFAVQVAAAAALVFGYAKFAASRV